MPRHGGRYVVFLNHVDKDDNLSILTAYELRDDRVVPMDGKSAAGAGTWVFDQFKDSDVLTFLTAVTWASKPGLLTILTRSASGQA